jgi:hypothetical protein
VCSSDLKPDSSIRIDFDRALNLSSVTAANISIAYASDASRVAAWTYAYDTTQKRLTIIPNSLDGGVAYLVTIGTGLLGANGEALKESYSWSFTTSALPSGTMKINGDATYTRIADVTMNLSVNNLVTQYFYSTNLSDFTGSQAFLSLPNVLPMTQPYHLGGSDGTYTIYIQFKTASGLVTDILNDSIILDTTPPLAPSLSSPSSPTTSRTPTWSWAGGGGGNGTFMYFVSGAWSNETSATSFSPTTGLSDGTYYFYVKERDDAGNWSALKSSSVVVNAPPNAPTVTVASPTLDTTPSWSWVTGGYGNGSFQYQLDSTSGTWTPTTATSYVPASEVADGTHTLYVEESDGADWSAAGTAAVRVSQVLPYLNQVVDMTPLFQWRPPLALNGVTFTYSLQILGAKEGWTNLITGLKRNSYQVTSENSLAGDSIFTFRVVAVSSLEATVYIPSSSGSAFRTNERR